MPDALQMLKEDHRKVQDMFKEFESAERPAEKKRIVTEVIKELEVHTRLEEEIFYPAVAKEAEPEGDIMEEAEEEHHVVDLIIAELRRMQPTAKQYDAKFKVLAENVKHHIQEEESLMLPKAAELGGERMSELGEEMLVRKAELLRATTGRPTNGRRPSTNGRSTARRSTAGTRRTTTARRRATGTTRRVGAAARKPSTTRTSRATATRTRSRAASAAAGTRKATRARGTARGRRS